MSKLVPYAILLILVVFSRITVSEDSSPSYYSGSYGGGVSSNDVDASFRGYESPTSEENQYDTPPSLEGDTVSTNPYFEAQYNYPPNAGADNSYTADDDVTHASTPDMSSAPSLETIPNNSDEAYKDELSPSSSYYDSPPHQIDSSSSPSYYDSSSSSDDWSSSSSSTTEEDSSLTTTDESQLVTEERYNPVEELGSGVDSTEMKTEHSGSKAGLVFGVLIGFCAVGAAGFIYIKKKRESYPNTNSYISLTRWDRI